MKIEEVIGSWYICNNASLNLYAIYYGIPDTCLVGINDDIPEEKEIITGPDGDSCIEFGGELYSFSECIRVGD